MAGINIGQMANAPPSGGVVLDVLEKNLPLLKGVAFLIMIQHNARLLLIQNGFTGIHAPRITKNASEYYGVFTPK